MLGKNALSTLKNFVLSPEQLRREFQRKSQI